MRNASAHSKPLRTPNTRSNRSARNDPQSRTTSVPPATAACMRNPVTTDPDAGIGTPLRSSVINVSPSPEALRVMMSEIAANSTPPDVRPLERRATTPTDPSSKKCTGSSDKTPDWPGAAWSNGNGTYQLYIGNNDPRVAGIQAVLSEQSCITELSFRIYSFEGQCIHGLQQMCAGLRHNRGLKIIKVLDFTPPPALANADELFQICDAVRDHPDLEKLMLPERLFTHGAALNNELIHPRSRLKELRIALPSSQQQTDAFAEALEKNSGLTYLDLTLTAQSAPKHERLAKALASLRALTKLRLNFDDGAIGTSDGRTLFGGLAGSRSLRELCVVGLGDRQAIGLRDFLSTSQSVQQLELNRSRLSKRGGVLFSAGLDRNLSILKVGIYLSLDTHFKVERQMHQVIERTQRRNALLQKSALVGHGIAAGMLASADLAYRKAALPADAGALIAEAVAVHLDPKDAQCVYQALLL